MATQESPPIEPARFAIQQRRDQQGIVYLRLVGELDLATTDHLRGRFGQLKRAGDPVRLDLSQLQFIDCCGLHGVLSCVDDAHASGWRLEVDPKMSASVARLVKLTGVASQLWPTAEPASRAMTEALLEQTARLLSARRAAQDKQVRELIPQAVSAGVSTQDIARTIGVSRATLWRRYSSELRQARHRAA